MDDVGSLVVVTQDFISELDEELSLFAGDIVQILEVVDKHWFRGECNGTTGKFPRSFVRDKPLPGRWKSALAGGSPRAPPGASDTRRQQKDETGDQADVDKARHNLTTSERRLFAALADFAATEDGDLAFCRGDLLLGTEALDANWWRAEDADGRCGIVPLSHVWTIDREKLPREEQARVNRRARVILTMKAQLDDEIDLVKDEIVTVRRFLDRDWYWGEKDCGIQGRFPKSFVTLLDEMVPDNVTSTHADDPPSFEECMHLPQLPADASGGASGGDSLVALDRIGGSRERYSSEAGGGTVAAMSRARECSTPPDPASRIGSPPPLLADTGQCAPDLAGNGQGPGGADGPLPRTSAGLPSAVLVPVAQESTYENLDEVMLHGVDQRIQQHEEQQQQRQPEALAYVNSPQSHGKGGFLAAGGSPAFSGGSGRGETSGRSSTVAGVEPYALTKYAFRAQYPNELSFEAGHIVKLLRHVDDEWIEGELAGRAGLFPTDYVEIVVDLPTLATEPLHGADPLQPATASDAERRDANGDYAQQPSLSAGGNTSDCIAGTLAKALYDFESGVAGDLHLKEGDLIVILEKINADWYKARNTHGDVGICPTSYVQELADPLTLLLPATIGAADPGVGVNENGGVAFDVFASLGLPPQRQQQQQQQQQQHVISWLATSSPPAAPSVVSSDSGGDAKSVTNCAATAASRERRERHERETGLASKDHQQQQQAQRTSGLADLRSQPSTPEEEDFSWDFGSPDREGLSRLHGSSQQRGISTSLSSFIRFSPPAAAGQVSIATAASVAQEHPQQQQRTPASRDLLLSPVESLPAAPSSSDRQLIPARPPPPPPAPLSYSTVGVAWPIPDGGESSEPRSAQSKALAATRSCDVAEASRSASRLQFTPQRPAPPVPSLAAAAVTSYEARVVSSTAASAAAADDGGGVGNSDGQRRRPAVTTPVPAAALAEQQRREDSRLRKQREQRQCVITEMIQTERDYRLDLRLCFDAFLRDQRLLQARALGIDTVTLFGNLDEVLEVSSQLLSRLESEQRRPESEQRVGAAFGDLVTRLQDIYSHYCRNHDDVSSLLAKYDRDPDISRFLNDGISEMQRSSNCFDLASVLIKPVQRILKYPLLISELEKSTEESHPDKQLLLRAIDDMAKVATDINEMKRRKDLVSKYRGQPLETTSFSQKLSKFNFHSVVKKSTRLTVKMSSSLGFTTVVRDEDFEREEQQFLLLEKSIKTFLRSTRTFCSRLHDCLRLGLQLAEDVCDFHGGARSGIPSGVSCTVPGNVAPTVADAFRAAQQAIYAEHWAAFTRTIGEHVAEPLHAALAMLAGPHNIIGKRYHKLLDLAACTARTEKNRDATRQRAFDEDEAAARTTYNALNSQLLDELPRLCTIGVELLRSAVDAFLRARKLLIARITQRLLELAEQQPWSQPCPHQHCPNSHKQHKRPPHHEQPLPHNIGSASGGNSAAHSKATGAGSAAVGCCSGCGNSVLDRFEQRHREALYKLAAFSLLHSFASAAAGGNSGSGGTGSLLLCRMDSFGGKPGVSSCGPGGGGGGSGGFMRRSFNDRHRTALDLVPQTDSQRAWLRQEYGDNNVYTVALTVKTSDPSEIALSKGDLVGVVRSADASGNPMRWYVDNGRCKGHIASKHLLRDSHQRDSEAGPKNFARLSSATCHANKFTAARPTSLATTSISTMPAATATAAVAARESGVASAVPAAVTGDSAPSGVVSSAAAAAAAAVVARESHPTDRLLSSGGVSTESSVACVQPSLRTAARATPTLVNGDAVKVLPAYPSHLPLQPSKRVVNPIISNLPNRSGSGCTIPRAGDGGSVVGLNPSQPVSATANVKGVLQPKTGFVTTGTAAVAASTRRQQKPLPELPPSDVRQTPAAGHEPRYLNLDADAFGNDVNDASSTARTTSGEQRHSQRALIDVRQRLEEYYYALYKLEDVGPGQLPLSQGQVVLVIFTCDLENNAEWWFVEDRYGNQGYVPASYLRKYKTS